MYITKINTTEKFKQAKDFLLPYEADCVQLASYVRKEMENLFVIKDDERTAGIIYAKGTFLHCIPDFEKREEELTRVLSDFLLTHHVTTINGSLSVSEKVSSILQAQGRKLLAEKRYFLMKISAGDEVNPPESPLTPDDEIKRCNNPEHDIDLLFELQEGFVKEEVAASWKNTSDAEIRLILKQILKNQICLVLFSDGQAAAKVNTNAIGWNCVQIGGVYTHPRLRRNGYSWQLLYNLCRRILRTGRSAVLFVKENNMPARTLYQKLGFKDFARFSITYFYDG